MTAKCSIELRSTAQAGHGAINGRCIAQEELAVGAAATTTLVVSDDHKRDKGASHFRISTDDTAAYVAVGPVPNPDATAATHSTTARTMVPAGATVEVPATQGDKVAAKAVA